MRLWQVFTVHVGPVDVHEIVPAEATTPTSNKEEGEVDTKYSLPGCGVACAFGVGAGANKRIGLDDR